MFKKITKAIIPTAGFGTRFLPSTKALPKEMFPIGNIPAIQLIVEEAQKAGITEILILTNESKTSIINHFDHNKILENELLATGKVKEYKLVHEIGNGVNIYSMRPSSSKGSGDTVSRAEQFVGDEPFAVLLGDDIVFTKKNDPPAISQCIDVFQKTHCSVVGVQEVPDKYVSKYGIIRPASELEGIPPAIKINGIIEKPSLDKAPSRLAAMGRYVFTPQIFDYLRQVKAEHAKSNKKSEIQLTSAIDMQAQMQSVYACRFTGKRFDIGQMSGFVMANIYVALKESSTQEDLIDYMKSRISKYKKTKKINNKK